MLRLLREGRSQGVFKNMGWVRVWEPNYQIQGGTLGQSPKHRPGQDSGSWDRVIRFRDKSRGRVQNTGRVRVQELECKLTDPRENPQTRVQQNWAGSETRKAREQRNREAYQSRPYSELLAGLKSITTAGPKRGSSSPSSQSAGSDSGQWSHQLGYGCQSKLQAGVAY